MKDIVEVGDPVDVDVIGVVLDRVPTWTNDTLDNGEPGITELVEAYQRSLDVIATQEGRGLAGSYLVRLTGIKREVERHYRPFADAAHRLHKGITSRRGEVIKRIESEINRLKGLVLRYDKEEERKRIEEQKALREQLEQDRAKAAKEMEDEACRLAEAGKAEEAEELRGDAKIENATPVPSVIIPDLAPPPATSGIGKTRTWKWRYQDGYDDQKVIVLLSTAMADSPGLRPMLLSYIQLNDKAISAAVRAQKGAFSVPGIEAYEAEDVRIGRTYRSVQSGR